MIRIIISICILFLSSLTIYSQISDSIYTGSKYRFQLYDEREIIGAVVGQDSLRVYVKNEKGLYKLLKDDIFLISKDLSPSFYKVLLSLGGGVSFLSGVENRDYDYGYSFHAGVFLPDNESRAFKIDASFSGWNENDYEGPPLYQNNSSKRKIHQISLTGNIVWADFTSDLKVSLYGSVGLGACLWLFSEYYTSYVGYDSTLYTHYYEPKTRIAPVFSAGFGLNVPLNKKLKIYSDLQMYMASQYFIFLFWEDINFPVRVGLTYSLD